jgi:hypothetical protein
MGGAEITVSNESDVAAGVLDVSRALMRLSSFRTCTGQATVVNPQLCALSTNQIIRKDKTTMVSGVG